MSGGRASVRRALFMGAPVARRHNPVLAFFERLKAAGRCAMTKRARSVRSDQREAAAGALKW
jgi:hypothetical protein